MTDMAQIHGRACVSVDTKLLNNALECDAIMWFYVLEYVSQIVMLSIERVSC